jgi:hypothetical protein
VPKSGVASRHSPPCSSQWRKQWQRAEDEKFGDGLGVDPDVACGMHPSRESAGVEAEAVDRLAEDAPVDAHRPGPILDRQAMCWRVDQWFGLHIQYGSGTGLSINVDWVNGEHTRRAGRVTAR